MKFKMSVANLAGAASLVQEHEHLFSDSFLLLFFFFDRNKFYFIAATDTDAPIEILVAVSLQWRGVRQ